jgi:signal transduction histidine kinase
MNEMQIEADRKAMTRKAALHGSPAGVPLPRLRHRAAGPRAQVDRKPLESAIAGIAVERSRAGNALHLLTGKLLEAQEEERRRIARELHDGLNQQLAILAVELGMLAREVPADSKQLRESMFKLRRRAECLSDDLRNITHQLHPAVLEHLGLISALRSHCTEFSQHEGIRVWFITEQISGPPPEISICLYRIVQEALRNVAKHSGAREAWVRIKQENGVIQLSIIDKGVGIHPDAARETSGLGLISIRERVQLVNGQLQISAPGPGTRIRVRVPIQWKERTK